MWDTQWSKVWYTPWAPLLITRYRSLLTAHCSPFTIHCSLRMTHVLVVAATPAMRAGLQAILSAPPLVVVGAAPRISELAADFGSAEVIVIAEEALIDLQQMPDEMPALLVLSADNSAAEQLRNLRGRAWGIVLPDATPGELQTAVAAVAQGLIVLPPTLLEKVFEGAQPVTTLPREPLDEPLTVREQEVLQLLGQGLANKQIARQLHISEHTVKFHVSAIYSKLGASSRTEAVSRGARRGLLTL